MPQFIDFNFAIPILKRLPGQFHAEMLTRLSTIDIDKLKEIIEFISALKEMNLFSSAILSIIDHHPRDYQCIAGMLKKLHELGVEVDDFVPLVKRHTIKAARPGGPLVLQRYDEESLNELVNAIVSSMNARVLDQPLIDLFKRTSTYRSIARLAIALKQEGVSTEVFNHCVHTTMSIIYPAHVGEVLLMLATHRMLSATEIALVREDVQCCRTQQFFDRAIIEKVFTHDVVMAILGRHQLVEDGLEAEYYCDAVLMLAKAKVTLHPGDHQNKPLLDSLKYLDQCGRRDLITQATFEALRQPHADYKPADLPLFVIGKTVTVESLTHFITQGGKQKESHKRPLSPSRLFQPQASDTRATNSEPSGTGLCHHPK